MNNLLQSYIDSVHILEAEKNIIASQNASSVALASKLEVSYKKQMQGLEKFMEEMYSENFNMQGNLHNNRTSSLVSSR